MRSLHLVAAAAAALCWCAAAEAADAARATDAPFVGPYVFEPGPCAQKDKALDAVVEAHHQCMIAAGRREQSDQHTLGQVAEASLKACRTEQAVVAEHVGRCETPARATQVMAAFEAWAQEGVYMNAMDHTLRSRDTRGVDPAMVDDTLLLCRELYQACVAFEARHEPEPSADLLVDLTKANMRCSTYMQALQAYAGQRLTPAQAKEIIDESADEAGGLARLEMESLGRKPR